MAAAIESPPPAAAPTAVPGDVASAAAATTGPSPREPARPPELITPRLLESEALGLEMTLPRGWDLHRPAYPGALLGVRLWPLRQPRPVAQITVAVAGHPDTVATVLYRNRTALLALGFQAAPAPATAGPERADLAELVVTPPRRDAMVRQVYLARGHDILVVSLRALPTFYAAATPVQDRLVRALQSATLSAPPP